jgi:DNA-binding transcriptional ArsR family regulator
MIDSLFGSKTRVKLLRLFMNNPGRAFYVREITRLVGEQINSVRRELTNLSEVGIVKSNIENNRTYYEVSTNNQYFEPFRQIFSDKQFLANDNKVSISEWAKKFRSAGNIQEVVFAGQLVYGSDSKVDVLIAGDVSKIKLGNLIKALERENGGALAFTQMSYDEFYYRLSARDNFLTEILDVKHTVVLDIEKVLEKYQKGNHDGD